MGVLWRLLKWIWRRIGDSYTVADLLDLFDLKTAVTAIIGFVAMMLFGAANYDWSSQTVVLAALAAGAFVSLIFIGVRLAWATVMARAKPQLDVTLPQQRLREKQYEPTRQRSEPDRLSLLGLLDLAEKQHGWDFKSQTSVEILDFLYGLRQAGADRTVVFWGKTNRNQFEGLTRNELFVVIPKAHWVDYELDVWKALHERDNFYWPAPGSVDTRLS